MNMSSLLRLLLKIVIIVVVNFGLSTAQDSNPNPTLVSNLQFQPDSPSKWENIINFPPLTLGDAPRQNEVGYDKYECEERNDFGKVANNSRNPLEDKEHPECEKDLKRKLTDHAYRWGQNVVRLHGLFMLFAWTMASNCSIFCVRFLKENSVVEKGSGCIGIGAWLWGHIAWMYTAAAAIMVGFALIMFQEMEPICQLRNSARNTDDCMQYSFVHRIIGGTAIVIFLLSYWSGWVRPLGATLRSMLITYHAVSGYLAKYVGLISMVFVPPLSTTAKILIIMTDLAFWLMFGIATVLQCKMDAKMKDEIKKRKYFPVPEGIDTYTTLPYKNLRATLFPIVFLSQAGLFIAVIIHPSGFVDAIP